MFSEVINRIQELESSVYDPIRDKQKINELYMQILECSSDKESFIAKTEEIIKKADEGILSEEEKRQWLGYANGIFACFMAIKLYEEPQTLSVNELNLIEHYFKDKRLHKDVASMGMYSCAQFLGQSDPMRCYELIRGAFDINPSLAEFLDVDYQYDAKRSEAGITKECPFCGGTKATPHFCSPQVLKLNGKKHFPPAKLWMRCDQCGNYYTYEFPLAQVGTINGHYVRDSNAKTLENRFALHLYNDIFQRFKELTAGKLYLEIGVGSGEMLAVAQEFGYTVDAVEICREDCEKISSALNVDVKWCDIVNFNIDKKYDVIIMGDVFEHVTKPVEVLQKVKAMLNQDGVLWLSTPNYNCAYARMQKFTHCMWHELNHYTYVSFESLSFLLQQMGMEVVHYEMSQRYIGSMELFIKNQV